MKIIISQATHDLFRKSVLPGHTFSDRGWRKLPDGNIEIEIGEDTYDRINPMRLQGESDNDMFFRLLSLKNSKLN